jgi:hypothetical protein
MCVCIYNMCVYLCVFICVFAFVRSITYTHTYMHTYIHAYMRRCEPFVGRQGSLVAKGHLGGGGWYVRWPVLYGGVLQVCPIQGFFCNDRCM